MGAFATVIVNVYTNWSVSIICVISTIFVNKVRFYFLTFDDRYLGLLMNFLSKL